MEKIYKYTTLKGLISKTQQYSLSTFLSCRIYHIKKGWIKVELSKDLNEQINNLFSNFLNRDITKQINNFGIFERLIISKRTLKVEYIAGQDYTSELRFIRGLIKW